MELQVLGQGSAAHTAEGTPKFARVTLTNDEMISPSRATIAQAKKMLKLYGVNRLLTKSNPKTDKSTKFGYLTAPMHLAPGNLSGYEMCPSRSAGCTSGCLHTAGNPIFLQRKIKARVARTKFWMEQPDLFRAKLAREIELFVKVARKARLKPAVRLNATSDQVWEKKFPLLFVKFRHTKFYDYSAVAQRFSPEWKLPKNYSLTFSRKEDNDEQVKQVLAWGGNVAAVFGNCGISAHPKPLPVAWSGVRVTDGDLHDLRFLDPAGTVTGLRAKGSARCDTSGFVIW